MAFRFDDQYQPGTQWMGLSKTLSQGMTMQKGLKDAAEGDEKAYKQYQRDMNSLLGLTKTGDLSQEEYQKILDEANADAQKNGYIKAYENFTMFDSLDKERADMRLASWDEHMQRNIGRMSDVTNPYSMDQATQDWMDNQAPTEERPDWVVIGTDSTGAKVTNDLSASRPSELLAFGRGKAAAQMGIDMALSNLREKKTIEANGQRYGAEIYAGVGKVMNMVTNGPAITDEEKKEISLSFKAIANRYHGMGTDSINARTLGAIQNWIDDEAENGQIGTTLIKLYSLQDELENSIEFVDGAGMFAAKGTENALKLDAMIDSAESTIKARITKQKAIETAANASEEDKLTLGLAKRASELYKANGTITEDDKKNLYSKFLQDAVNGGHSDIDTMMGKVDGIIGNLSFDGNEKLREAQKQSARANKMDDKKQTEIQDNAYLLFQKGEISAGDLTDIISTTDAFIADKATLDAAILREKKADARAYMQARATMLNEGGYGTVTRAQREARSTEIMGSNDIKRQVSFGQWQTINSEDNTISIENQQILEKQYLDNKDTALEGGNIPALDGSTGYTPLTQAEMDRLSSMNNWDGTINLDEMGNNLSKTTTLPQPGMSTTAVRDNVNQINSRDYYHTQYLAIRRLLSQEDNYVSQAKEAAEQNEKINNDAGSRIFQLTTPDSLDSLNNDVQD